MDKLNTKKYFFPETVVVFYHNYKVSKDKSIYDYQNEETNNYVIRYHV